MVTPLALLAAIDILVYQPIPATPVAALCGTDPIATGTERYLRIDNDFFGVFGPRANAVSEHEQGTVTLVDGSVARLLARFQALGRPDGSLARFETTIRLHPIGHPE